MSITDGNGGGSSQKLSLAHGLKRDGTSIGLLFASLTGIVGSGWLLGPMMTAQVAGPYGVWSWAIGGLLILALALCYAELGPLIPRSGSAVHISRVGNGPMLAMVWTWILFLGYVTTAPTEVVAIVTYANNYVPGMLQTNSSLLSGVGFLVSAGLMVLLTAINMLRIGTILNVSRFLMVIKLIIPLLTIGQIEKCQVDLSTGTALYKARFGKVWQHTTPQSKTVGPSALTKTGASLVAVSVGAGLSSLHGQMDGIGRERCPIHFSSPSRNRFLCVWIWT